MKKFSFLAIGAMVMVGIVFASCDTGKTPKAANLKSEIDSVSFLIGQSYGAGNKKQFEQLVNQWPTKGNLEAFISGYIEGLYNEDDTLFLGRNMEATVAYVNAFFEAAANVAGEKNKEEAEQFLAQNKGKSGVITVESTGLQYQVITEGSGKKPTAEDMVRVHYTVKYLDGTVLDSSVERGQPADFPLMNVIPGFSQGLMLMPVGSKYTLWIPVDLGYGTADQRVRPNSLLIYEVELLEILPPMTQ